MKLYCSLLHLTGLNKLTIFNSMAPNNVGNFIYLINYNTFGY